MQIASQSKEWGEGAAQLLFIDDQQQFLDYTRRRFESLGYSVSTFTDWEQALSEVNSGQIRPDIIFVEPVTRNGDGTRQEFFKELVENEAISQIPVVVLSVDRDPDSILKAVNEGARSYICKPYVTEDLDALIRDLTTSSLKPARASRQKSIDFVFCSPKMERINTIIRQIADAPVPVLITGESGTGKDVIARLIHRESKLRHEPFVKVNCAAMPKELIESELFGYQKGAFTGAHVDRPGRFEFANGGTIFLDEIGEFSPSVQAKLLQVLQDGRFIRLGSNREMAVDVRVLAATNRDLTKELEEGNFREDLFYRLNVVSIEAAPLRERKEEIELFCDYFLKKFSEQYGSSITEIPAHMMELFKEYNWPGNVRELENLVRRYVVLGESALIEEELEEKLARQERKGVSQITSSYLDQLETDGEINLKAVSKEASAVVERSMIRKALIKTQWNRLQAAKHLHISYKSLLNKMDEYEIELEA